MTQENDIRMIINKLDELITRIYSQGGDDERGIHEQVHILEEKINDLDEKLNKILTILQQIEINS